MQDGEVKGQERRNTVSTPSDACMRAPASFEETLMRGIGEASMAWSKIPEGIFDAQAARNIGQQIQAQHERELVQARRQGFADGVRYKNT